MAGNIVWLREGLTFEQLLKSDRGQYIIARALRLAIQCIERMPEESRPESDKRDMVTVLTAIDKPEYF